MVLPSILKDCITRDFDICYIDSPLEFKVKKIRFACCRWIISVLKLCNEKIVVTGNTYSIHHFAGTWQPIWKKNSALFMGSVICKISSFGCMVKAENWLLKFI